MPANAVSSADLVIPDVWRHIHIRGFIAGYSGAAIARVLVGGTSIDSAGNYATEVEEAGAAANTTSINASGWPLAVSAITGARFFTCDIYNVAGIVKRCIGASNSNSVSAGTVPVVAQFAGIWVNTSNAIQRLRIAAFDTLTGTTLSASTLTAGTEFYAWGHNDD